MRSSSAGVVFELLHHITFLNLFLIYPLVVYALQSPKYCFDQSRETICGVTTAYPFDFISGQSCSYPGLGFDCAGGGRPFMNISNHIYNVLEIRYDEKVIRMVDSDANGSSCPHLKHNFSFPSSPPWVNYNFVPSFMKGLNLTIFNNCSSVPDYVFSDGPREEHLLCSQENSPPSYVFYYYDFLRDGFDWYGNCTENVVVPMTDYDRGKSYIDSINDGFEIGWSATGWCKDCENSGGQCWSIQNSTGCACKNNKSYNRTCPPPTPPPHQGKNSGLKIGIGVLCGTGVLLVALLVFCKRFSCFSHWRNKNKSPINIELFLEKYGCLALQRYKYSEIKKITNSFKDKLGQGGYGRVFKGELHDGRLVAVKLLNEDKGDGEDFINEVATIGRTNHVNVVNLVGFCIEGTQRALVYEFMPNGSLERFIYTQKESSVTLSLGWEKLYQIALGIARGLEYLHRGCNTRILHFDIKPHNILLDQNFCPKISDFGLAKLYPSRESAVSMVGARGTMGYIAPELYSRTFGNVSHKSDVYSYGMMMLEMIGGRKNIDATVDNISEIYFPLWIYNRLKQYCDINTAEDIHDGEVFEDENAKKMILVALWCIQTHPVDRPSMSKVVDMLEGSINELQVPPNPSVVPNSSTSTSS